MKSVMVNIGSTIYLAASIMVLFLGAVFLASAIAQSKPSIAYEQGPMYPVQLPSNYKLENLSGSLDFNNFMVKELTSGESYYIYKYYCVNISNIKDANIVRYIEGAVDNKNKIIIPMPEYPLVTTSVEGNDDTICNHSLTPLILPETMMEGSYKIKSYIIYTNFFGYNKLISLKDTSFYIKNKS